jgi:hypothetical protein
MVATIGGPAGSRTRVVGGLITTGRERAGAGRSARPEAVETDPAIEIEIRDPGSVSPANYVARRVDSEGRGKTMLCSVAICVGCHLVHGSPAGGITGGGVSCCIDGLLRCMAAF